jgi:hypothetical protein
MSDEVGTSSVSILGQQPKPLSLSTVAFPHFPEHSEPAQF